MGSTSAWRYGRPALAGVVCGVLVQIVAHWSRHPAAASYAGWAVTVLGLGVAFALATGFNMGTPTSSILDGRDAAPPLQSWSGAGRVLLFCVPVFFIGQL